MTLTPQGEAINVILGNFQTAADYRTYIENAATINALIAAEPESAFTAANDNYYHSVTLTNHGRKVA